MGFIHGQCFGARWQRSAGARPKQMIATAVMIFLIFLPLLAFGALGEVMEDKALFRTFFVERLEFEVADRQPQT